MTKLGIMTPPAERKHVNTPQKHPSDERSNCNTESCSENNEDMSRSEKELANHERPGKINYDQYALKEQTVQDESKKAL